MKIAMFGGSFDPVHIDHVSLCKTMLDTFNLDKVVVFPAACSPFKPGARTEDYHRLNMCNLAFAEEEHVEVSGFEINRGGKSYTVDTLNHLKCLYTDSKLYLITGADAFVTLDKWYKAKEIFSVAHILTVVRDNDDIKVLEKKAEEYRAFNARCTLVGTPIGAVSSTKVREAIIKGEDFSLYLPQKVTDYIKENRLYGYAD